MSAHSPAASGAAPPGLSTHRIEALTDGIYAVAMTLLVIELKLPEHGTGHDAVALGEALAGLLPKVLAWFISFSVLAIFWFGHHRALAHVRRTDGKLIALCIGQLGFVSLLPFSCSLIGEHGRQMVSQLIYSINMTGLAVMALLTSRYIHRHADGAMMAMSRGAYRGAQVRMFGLIAISALAVWIQTLLPSAGNMAFSLMAVVMPLSRVVERRSLAAAALAGDRHVSTNLPDPR